MDVLFFCVAIIINLTSHPEVYRTKFFEICDLYKDYSRSYTDGSRVEDWVVAAVDCQTKPASLELQRGTFLVVIRCNEVTKDPISSTGV